MKAVIQDFEASFLKLAEAQHSLEMNDAPAEKLLGLNFLFKY